jgi:hypothetical protein
MKKLERENLELRRANVKPMGSTITKMVMALRKAFKTNPMGVGSSIYGFLNRRQTLWGRILDLLIFESQAVNDVNRKISKSKIRPPVVLHSSGHPCRSLQANRSRHSMTAMFEIVVICHYEA